MCTGRRSRATRPTPDSRPAGIGCSRSYWLNFGRPAAVGHQPEQVAIAKVDVAVVGRAEQCRALRDLLEDRRELEAAVDDGREDFADGGQRLGAAVAGARRCAGVCSG